MRRWLAVAMFAAALGTASGAKAQNYPWCEYLGGDFGGGRNCGFISFEQCMASARGNGGDCRPNTLYTPPPGPHEQAMPAMSGRAAVHHHSHRMTPRRHHHS